MTILQILVLDALQNKDKMNVSELADALGLSNAAISSSVDQLVHLGFVDRSRCETDRRLVFVSLTEDGEAKLEECLGAESPLMKRLGGMMNLPDHELETLLSIHQKLIENYTKYEEETC